MFTNTIIWELSNRAKKDHQLMVWFPRTCQHDPNLDSSTIRFSFFQLESIKDDQTNFLRFVCWTLRKCKLYTFNEDKLTKNLIVMQVKLFVVVPCNKDWKKLVLKSLRHAAL